MLQTRAWFAAAVVAGAIYGSVAAAQKFPWQSGSDTAAAKTPPVVEFIGPEQVSVAPKRVQDLELHFRVAPGYHINSHTPHSKTLIPTQLMVAEGSGLEVTGVDFPPGTETSFAFAPTEKLNVYTGDVVLHAHVKAQAGSQLLQGALRYQACDTNACMPPKRIPVAVSILAK